MVLCERWRWALRSRLAGGGYKPPQAASVKSRGGERCGKGALRVRQVWIVKASANEPLLTCRKAVDDIRTGVGKRLRDEPEGYLSTALVVSGMKRARARSRLLHGTGEPVVLESSPAGGGRGGGRASNGRNRERQSTGPGHRGGPSRNSGEAPVMGVERRGRVIRVRSQVNR
jgi:hypothetical protein